MRPTWCSTHRMARERSGDRARSCSDRGARHAPATADLVRAKAAVPVNGEPLVAAIRAAGRSRASAISSSTCTTGPRRSPPSSATARPRRARPILVGKPGLGSAGGPRHACRCWSITTDGGDRVLIVNGDTLTTSICALMPAHASVRRARHDGADSQPAAGQYGGVVVRGRRVTGSHAPAEPRRGVFHFIGVQVAEARAFAALEDGVPRVGERSIRGSSAAAGTRSRRMSSTLRFWISARRRLSRRTSSSSPDEGSTSPVPLPCESAESSVGTVVWDDVTVGAGATRRLHRRRRRQIPAGARYERCAIVRA